MNSTSIHIKAGILCVARRRDYPFFPKADIQHETESISAESMWAPYGHLERIGGFVMRPDST